MPLPRRFLVVAMAATALLAGCGGDEPAPEPASYAPLTYGFLTKLRLNVGSVDVEDHTTPLGEPDVSAVSPVPPLQAVMNMAHDRLVAVGFSGRAVFSVDQAHIVRGPGDALNGEISVHIDVFGADGGRTGYAEARVSRQHTPGSEPENQRVVLYDITRGMMDDLNVELEYQLRRSLGALLVSGAVVPQPVHAAPLQPESLAPPSAAPPSVAPPSAAPPPAAPPPGDAPAPLQMSPPPGFLHLPPGSGSNP